MPAPAPDWHPCGRLRCLPCVRSYREPHDLPPTPGGTRRYSDNDITWLCLIGDLIGAGVNLAGVARILGLKVDNTALHTHNTSLQELNTALHTDNAALIARNHQLRNSARNDAAPAPPMPVTAGS